MSLIIMRCSQVRISKCIRGHFYVIKDLDIFPLVVIGIIKDTNHFDSVKDLYLTIEGPCMAGRWHAIRLGIRAVAG